MYDEQYFFVENPFNRYTLSPRNSLKLNADGSLDFYLQHENPGHGQGVQLAAGADGQIHPHAAAVLAAGKVALDHRRHLENPAGEESVVEPSALR